MNDLHQNEKCQGVIDPIRATMKLIGNLTRGKSSKSFFVAFIYIQLNCIRLTNAASAAISRPLLVLACLSQNGIKTMRKIQLGCYVRDDCGRKCQVDGKIAIQVSLPPLHLLSFCAHWSWHVWREIGALELLLLFVAIVCDFYSSEQLSAMKKEISSWCEKFKCSNKKKKILTELQHKNGRT